MGEITYVLFRPLIHALKLSKELNPNRYDYDREINGEGGEKGTKRGEEKKEHELYSLALFAKLLWALYLVSF